MRVRSVQYGLLACGLLLMTQPIHAQHGTGGPPNSGQQHGNGPGGFGGPGGPPNTGGPMTQHTQSGATSSTSTGSRTGASGLQFGPPGRWWDDSSVRKTIGLSATQQKKMDSIFDANKMAIVSSYQTLTAQQAKLDAMNKQANVDSKALFAQIDAVNQARAGLQKATSEMLLQLRGQMDAAQIGKLQTLQ